METPDDAVIVKVVAAIKGNMSEWSPADEYIIEGFVRQTLKLGRLFCKKHHDYGPNNIASSGELGVLVRLRDKVARLSHLRNRTGNNESKEDTWSDIANYAIIALLVREGVWPDVEEGWDI